MSTTGWIFLVGMRVFDLGGMIVWLVWFMRQRDEPDDWSDWDDPGGGEDPPERPDGPRGPGIEVPLPEAGPWPVRLRDHTDAGSPGRRRAPARREREHEPVTPRQPAARSRGAAVQQAPGFSLQKAL